MNANAAASPPGRPPRRLTAALFVAAALACSSGGSVVAAAGPTTTVPPQEPRRMKIQITVGSESAAAVLDDSAAGRDFAALLPLSLNLTDYARIERIADLPRRLSTAGAPDGVAAKTGDIAYYAPWGNLAIFIDDGAYARGLVRLGRIESGLPLLRRPGPFTVRIERAVD